MRSLSDDLARLPFRNAQHQFPLLRLQTLARAQDGAQARGTQVFEGAQIENQRSRRAIDFLETLPLEFRCGFRIQTAADREHLSVAQL